MAGALIAAVAAFFAIMGFVALAKPEQVAGRVASRLIDGAAGFYSWLFFGVEIVLASSLMRALFA